MPRNIGIARVFGCALLIAASLASCAGGALHPTSSSTPPDPRGSGAGAQQSPPGRGAAPPTTTSRVATLNDQILSRMGPAESGDDLSLGPGDLIIVSVFQVPELSQLNVRIPSNGEIVLPLVGVLPAAGRTARQVEQDLAARLRERYMHDPHVAVFIQEHRSQQIAVFGSVKTGGVYPLVSRLRVTDALAMAGALNEDADHVVYLIRRPSSSAPGSRAQPGAGPTPPSETTDDEVMIPINLEAAVTESGGANPPLRAGDVIHVPRAGSYYVGGEVVRPGSFVLKGKTTVHQAIVNAGGVTPTADRDDVRVYRPVADGQSQVLKFSLNELEKRQGSDVEVTKNDVVILGNSAFKSIGYGVLNFIKFGIGATLF
jgi:polysaccharide biosynthesis/export protein